MIYLLIKLHRNDKTEMRKAKENVSTIYLYHR